MSANRPSVAPEQRQILSALFRLLPVKPDAELTSWGRAGDRERLAGYCELSGDESAWFVFSLPTGSGPILVAPSDDAPKEVGRLLAALEEHYESSSSARAGHLLRNADSFLQARDRAGTILLSPKTLGPLVNLGAKEELGSQTRDVYIVLFLNSWEMAYAETKGIDALMDIFEETSRDIFSVKAPPTPST